MADNSNIVIFRNSVSKKFFDIKDYANSKKNLSALSYIHTNEGYTEIFQKGKIPIEVINYLHQRGQDFGFVLSELHKGVLSYKKRGVPPYAEVGLTYLRQMNDNADTDETIYFDSLSRSIENNRFLKEKASEKVMKLFSLHIIGFICSVYYANRDRLTLPLSVIDVSIIMTVATLQGISVTKLNEILFQTQFNRNHVDIIKAIVAMRDSSQPEIEAYLEEQNVLERDSAYLVNNEKAMQRLNVLTLFKVLYCASKTENKFLKNRKKGQLFFLDVELTLNDIAV